MKFTYDNYGGVGGVGGVGSTSIGSPRHQGSAEAFIHKMENIIIFITNEIKETCLFMLTKDLELRR